MMTNHVFETDGKCSTCDGTGLYVGMGERDGAAVVCSRCKGEGHYTHRLEWEDFDGRKVRKGVERVFRANPGIVIGGPRLDDFGGLNYPAWYGGESFPPRSEDRKHTCPAWWYQSADYDLKPDWENCYDSLGSTFSNCRHFPSRERCWSRWDAENGGGK